MTRGEWRVASEIGEPPGNHGRFVVLEHDHPTLHWDLMLEVDGVLKTWRLASPPTIGVISAQPIADHRIAYLDYEGPISGGRGTVHRWDRGTYAVEREEFLMAGSRLKGRIVLAQNT